MFKSIILVRVLPLITALLFVAAGVSKFLGSAWARNFERWGLPPSFCLIVGVIEVLGGLGLLAPGFRRPAALVLGGVMAGAIVVTLWHGEPRFARTAAVYLALLAGVMAGAKTPTTDARAIS